MRSKATQFINAWKDRTDYLEDPVVLRQALDQYEAWKGRCGTDGDEGYYFWLRTQQDQNDPKLKAQFNKVEAFSKKIENDSQFFYLRIARIKPEQQQKFLQHESLRKYRHFLERVFAESRFHLSEPEEKILNLKASTSYANWTKMTSGFLSKEERVIVAEDGTRKPRLLFRDRGAHEQQDANRSGMRQPRPSTTSCTSTWRLPRRSSTRCSRTRRSMTSSGARRGPTSCAI